VIDTKAGGAGTLEERRDAIYARLEYGYAIVERALASGDGRRAESMEDFWLQLLAEYEDVCHRVQRATE
jgi:hypothetical protein